MLLAARDKKYPSRLLALWHTQCRNGIASLNYNFYQLIARRMAGIGLKNLGNTCFLKLCVAVYLPHSTVKRDHQLQSMAQNYNTGSFIVATNIMHVHHYDIGHKKETISAYTGYTAVCEHIIFMWLLSLHSSCTKT